MNFPHKPDVAALREWLVELNWVHARNLTEADTAEANREDGFFTAKARQARELAALAYATDRPLEDVRAHLSASCRFAGKALDLGFRPHAGTCIDYLATAIIVDERKLRDRLERFDRESFIYGLDRPQEPEIAEAYGLLSRGLDEEAHPRLEKARAAIGRAEPVRTGLDGDEQTLLALEEALVAGNEGALAQAIRYREEHFVRTYSRRADRQDTESLLDYRGLGLLRLSRERGIPIGEESIYLPLALLPEVA